MLKNLSLAAIVIGLLMVLIAIIADTPDKSDFDAAKEIIVMRSIAHRILIYTGDSTSAIAPVIRLSPCKFQIPFETSFSFKTDSLVSIIDKVIANNGLPSKYIVNVLERKTDKVVYGYAVLGPEQKNIVPCTGRNQPAKPYSIDIRFEERQGYPAKSLLPAGVSLLGAGLLALGIGGYKRRKDKTGAKDKEPGTLLPVEDEITENKAIPIGHYLFYADDQKLKFYEEETVLTVKESKILLILANAPNQIIDRKRLQKEIWEDEGVIVGRSLDMYISRLRKKLENDPGVKIVNSHGKGYKLDIGGQT